MRAIWTGAISFGLVNIPIKLYSGSEATGMDFSMLHKEDLSPIRYARICREDGKEIPYEEIVKGYEYRKGDYIVITDDDFKAASPKMTKTIEITEFTDESEIDVRYFEKPYYLEPDKGAAKPYTLLREALVKSGKIAIASFVLRNKEHLAAIKPVGKLLVLNQMRFPSELRQPGELKLPDEAVQKKEIDMALALIDQLTTHFIPEDHHDTYTEQLEKVIERKVRGEDTVVREKAPKAEKTSDLMAALKASLEAQRSK